MLVSAFSTSIYSKWDIFISTHLYHLRNVAPITSIRKGRPLQLEAAAAPSVLEHH